MFLLYVIAVSGTKENNSPTSERGALDEDDEKVRDNVMNYMLLLQLNQP